MKRERVNSGKRGLLIGAFILVIALIGFGYASLETTLQISGNTTISAVGWLVHFTNMNVTEGSFTNGGSNTSEIVYLDDTKVSFNIALTQPGQFYEFSFKVKNDGTLNAKLDSIVEEGTSSDVYDNLPYFEYTIDGIPAEESVLEPNQEYTITIKVEYSDDITADQLPTQPFTFEKTIELNYVQAD